MSKKIKLSDVIKEEKKLDEKFQRRGYEEKLLDVMAIEKVIDKTLQSKETEKCIEELNEEREKVKKIKKN